MPPTSTHDAMEDTYPPVRLKVWGDFACFTRPEMKVERVSYDVMTPSAARGILEAIYWKPQFQWRIRRIHVLAPIRRFSILRTEVKSKAVVSSAQRGERYFVNDDHTQRHTLALRDVAYLIEADVHLHPKYRDDADNNVAKHRDQFRRRVARGQSFHHPYLGCREFAAHFGAPDDTEAPPPELVGRTEPLGRMLFDLAFADGGQGSGVPRFFNAVLEDGVLHVPAHLYDALEP